MKTRYNKIAILGLAAATFFACETDDKIVDGVLADVGTGAIIRTIDEDNDLVYNDETDAFDAGSTYALVLEEQDEENGALLSSLDIFVNFDDNSSGGTDMTTAEVLLETLQASDFSSGDRGLPQVSVSYTSDELVTATGIDESMIVGKDRFEFRLVLTLTNGEVYTNSDVGGPVSGGAFFSAPFEYFPVIACSITEDLSGTHSYVVTNQRAAPGGGGVCGGADIIGTVTWTETEAGSGVYTSSDMSFGQYEDCYVGRGAAASDEIEIEWDCTLLTPDGEVFLDDDGVVVGEDDADSEVTFSYEITNVTGADMTIEFSSSTGDAGTVVLTREGGVDWPVIFTANN
ncbi:hypothetical protein [Flagellimonas allohymeniacidonis]|uniref:Uncharacterized protein n=1 Tax=Flagellimonas allohymeniacidonis TaxID=2517819 RepID=A0A4Q8QGJ0_9FLAO|nr:hypothetical protein [Allomuricauda hymeniacidonis]TAI49682.1 hypothetical protein EW142_07750 [Allomuricauda hymeniacidonis]